MKLAGPTLRHWNALTVAESSVCAPSGAAQSIATTARRFRCMEYVIEEVEY